MFLGHSTIFKGLATIFVLSGVASSLAISKTERAVENDTEKWVRSRWTTRNLTYKILNYPESLSQADCDSEIKLAFDLWSQHANFNFKQIRTTDPVHIEIQFIHGDHGDEYPLEGGDILSHSYAPGNGGDIHFDSSQNWSTNSENGYQLSRVAAHEIGHSLGLETSSNRSSIMYPIYRSTGPLQLSADDIESIQKVYDSEHIFFRK